MKFKNLTPHNITIRTTTGDVIVPTSGIVARVTQVDTPYTKTTSDGNNDIVLYSTSYSDVQGLPDPDVDTMYIVSQMVAQAVKSRPDVVYPGRPIRNEAGLIVATDGLCHA